MSYYDKYYFREPFVCTTNDNEFITPFPEECRIPNLGLSENKSSRLVDGLLKLDSDPILNVAGYSANSLEPKAVKLMGENAPKNYSNLVIYRETEELERKSVSMILDLFGERDQKCGAGVSTQGSEEAIYLAGLNYKFNWEKKWCECDMEPEIIIGSNAHISWFKFAQYFKVKPIVIPVNEEYTLDVRKVEKYLRKNTICVVGTIGDSYTGRIDNIEKLNDTVEKFNSRFNLDIPIHVDGANGGFILPFYGPLRSIPWNFTLSCVRSINASSHSYGFVFPGLGWIIWRNREDINEKLIFTEDYYGVKNFEISINYSRNASNISAQYFLFTRYGKRGYEKLDEYIYEVRRLLKDRFQEMKIDGKHVFDVIWKEESMPMIIFKPEEWVRRKGFSEDRFIDRMRRFGWSIGANCLPEPYRNKRVIRFILNIGFNLGMAEKLAEDAYYTVRELMEPCPWKEECDYER